MSHPSCKHILSLTFTILLSLWEKQYNGFGSFGTLKHGLILHPYFLHISDNIQFVIAYYLNQFLLIYWAAADADADWLADALAAAD